MTDAEFVERLQGEVAGWRRDALVTEAQAREILARYGESAAGRNRGKLGLFLGFIGALLVGIGVIVFFASNWEEVPGWAKLFMIFLSVLASQYAGYRLRYESEDYPGTGNALLFLGQLLFGAALFLIAQGFHVNANAPSLLLLWAMGVLPMAYLLKSRAMLVLVVLNLAVALGWETTFWLGESTDYGALFVFLSVYLLFGCLLYALGSLHRRFDSLRPFHLPYGVLGLFFIMGALLPPTFGGLHEVNAYGPASMNDLTGLLPRFVVFAAVATGAALAALFARREPSRIAALENAVVLALCLLGAALFFYEGNMGGAAAVLFNLILLAVILGAFALGTWMGEPGWINVGVLFFAVLVTVRYFDFFWKLLDRSLFFIGAGVLLLGGGMALERARRRLLDGLRDNGEMPGVGLPGGEAA